MNRRSIASIELDDDGVAIWRPTPKFIALGFTETPLGFRPNNRDLFIHDVDDNLSGHLPREALDRVVELNRTAREAWREVKKQRIVN
jgi:hypothetical protein